MLITKSKINKILSVFLLIGIFCSFLTTAFASDLIDYNKKGTVSISIAKDDCDIDSIDIVAYCVAEFVKINDNYEFELTEEFSDCKVDLSDIQSEKVVASLSEYTASNNLNTIKKTISKENKILFNNLDVGLYLFVQKNADKNEININPFLISVPSYEDGAYIYNISANPKIEVNRYFDSESTTTPKEDESQVTDDDFETTDTDNGDIDTTNNGNNNGNGTTNSLKHSTTNNSSDYSASISYKGTTSKYGGSVTSSSSSTLPKTGQLNWPIPVLIVSGLWIFLIGWVIKYNSKKEICEKD